MLGLLAGMAVSLALPVVAVSVAEQDFPSKPIRIIAPFGPGTATDTVARVIANEMGKLAGQSVVVENKPGAEGQIGAQAAAAPDGGVPAHCRATPGLTPRLRAGAITLRIVPTI